MKIKKVLILMIILVTCSARWPTVASGQQEKELSQSVKELQEKIKELEKTIKEQQRTIGQAKKAYERVKKQLDEQVKENERLKTICKEAGVNTAKIADASFNPSDIVYRGKERTQKWFERMYERFYDEIVYFNGTYIHKEFLAQDSNKIRELTTQAQAKGNIIKSPFGCIVFQVLGPNEAIILREGFTATVSGGSNELVNQWYNIAAAGLSKPEILFHLTGYKSQLVDKQNFQAEGYLISNGVFEYTNTQGAKRTIQSFKVLNFEPLTREQFADAITSGFELINYKKVGNKIIKRPIR